MSLWEEVRGGKCLCTGVYYDRCSWEGRRVLIGSSFLVDRVTNSQMTLGLKLFLCVQFLLALLVCIVVEEWTFSS